MELLKKGRSIREISKEVKMSNSTICHINKRMTVLEKEKLTNETFVAPSPDYDSSKDDTYFYKQEHLKAFAGIAVNFGEKIP